MDNTILEPNGLCLIDTETFKLLRHKEKQKLGLEIGKEYPLCMVLNTQRVNTILRVCSEINLIPKFIDPKFGILDYDSKIKYYNNKTYISKDIITETIISEQAYRLCINNLTDTIVLISLATNKYKYIINGMRNRGIKVFTPLDGYKINALDKVIELCFDKDFLFYKG